MNEITKEDLMKLGKLALAHASAARAHGMALERGFFAATDSSKLKTAVANETAAWDAYMALHRDLVGRVEGIQFPPAEAEPERGKI
jgi:hypothetical protein